MLKYAFFCFRVPLNDGSGSTARPVTKTLINLLGLGGVMRQNEPIIKDRLKRDYIKTELHLKGTFLML